MTSEEINNKIDEIEHENEKQPNKFEYQCFGGKVFPYIGWFWRTVNFDRDSCVFGVCPSGPSYEEDQLPAACEEAQVKLPVVGFMENNKWEYDEIICDGDKWKEIKQLVVLAVENPNRETLKALNDKIQSLLKK